MGNGTRPTPPATPTPGTSVSNNSSTSPILYIAIAAAIGVGGYFLFSNKGSEKTDLPTKPVTEQIVSESTPTTNETTNKQSKRQNKTTSSVKHSQATITPKVKEESQSKKTSSYAAEPSTARESVPVQPKLQTAGDYYSAAKSAYNRGNYTQAVSQFQEAAAKGDVASYYYLSTIYREGNGVGKSVNTAFQYMLKAAQGGYVAAYYELAEMYRGGRGTEKNIPQARVWYQKVIDTGGKNADRAKRALDNCN
nr:tetratricopeptide repeat protein [Bacteroides fragilis]